MQNLPKNAPVLDVPETTTKLVKTGSMSADKKKKKKKAAKKEKKDKKVTKQGNNKQTNKRNKSVKKNKGGKAAKKNDDENGDGDEEMVDAEEEDEKSEEESDQNIEAQVQLWLRDKERMPGFLTGFRPGETIRGHRDRTKGAELSIELQSCIVPPRSSRLAMVKRFPAHWSRFLGNLSYIPFFRGMSTPERVQWLEAHAVDGEGHMSDLGESTPAEGEPLDDGEPTAAKEEKETADRPTRVRFRIRSLGDSDLATKIPAADLDALIEQGVCTAREIYRKFDVVTQGRHRTLFFLPSFWHVCVPYERVDSFSGIVIHLARSETVQSYTAQPNEALFVLAQCGLAIAVPKVAPQERLDRASARALVDKLWARRQATPGAIPEAAELCWMTMSRMAKLLHPSMLKSEMQKLVRYRPEYLLLPNYDDKAEHTSSSGKSPSSVRIPATYAIFVALVQLMSIRIPATYAICVVFVQLMFHPGCFLPELGTYVTGMESAFKRAAVTLGEDGFTDVKNMFTLLGNAMMAKFVDDYLPPAAMVEASLVALMDSIEDPRCFAWNNEEGRKYRDCVFTAACPSDEKNDEKNGDKDVDMVPVEGDDSSSSSRAPPMLIDSGKQRNKGKKSKERGNLNGFKTIQDTIGNTDQARWFACSAMLDLLGSFSTDRDLFRHLAHLSALGQPLTRGGQSRAADDTDEMMEEAEEKKKELRPKDMHVSRALDHHTSRGTGILYAMNPALLSAWTDKAPSRRFPFTPVHGKIWAVSGFNPRKLPSDWKSLDAFEQSTDVRAVTEAQMVMFDAFMRPMLPLPSSPSSSSSSSSSSAARIDMDMSGDLKSEDDHKSRDHNKSIQTSESDIDQEEEDQDDDTRPHCVKTVTVDRSFIAGLVGELHFKVGNKHRIAMIDPCCIERVCVVAKPSRQTSKANGTVALSQEEEKRARAEALKLLAAGVPINACPPPVPEWRGLSVKWDAKKQQFMVAVPGKIAAPDNRDDATETQPNKKQRLEMSSSSSSSSSSSASSSSSDNKGTGTSPSNLKKRKRDATNTAPEVLVPWDVFRTLRVTYRTGPLPNVVDAKMLDLSVDKALRYHHTAAADASADMVCNAKALLDQWLSGQSLAVIDAAAAMITAQFGGEIVMPSISRDGGGVKDLVRTSHILGYQCLVQLSLLYPSAIAPVPGEPLRLRIKSPPLLWFLRDQLRAHVKARRAAQVSASQVKSAESKADDKTSNGTPTGWKVEPDRTGRVLKPTQAATLSRMAATRRAGCHVHLNDLKPGAGKTLINSTDMRNLIAAGEMNKHAVYLTPKEAITAIVDEFAGFAVKILVPKKDVPDRYAKDAKLKKLVLHLPNWDPAAKPLSPHTVILIEHDYLRDVVDKLVEYDDLYVVADEMHKMLRKKTLRSDSLKRLMETAKDVTMQTGTLIIDSDLSRLDYWLQQINTFPVTRRNRLVAALSRNAHEHDLAVKLEDPKVVRAAEWPSKPMQLLYEQNLSRLRVLPQPNDDASQPNRSPSTAMPSLQRALALSYSGAIPTLLEELRKCIIDDMEPGAMIVANNRRHAEEIRDAIVAYGHAREADTKGNAKGQGNDNDDVVMQDAKAVGAAAKKSDRLVKSANDIFIVGPDGSVNLTPAGVRSGQVSRVYKFVVVPKNNPHGFSLTIFRTMFDMAYCIKLDTKQQLLGRVWRQGQEAQSVRVITILLGGVTECIYAKSARAQSMQSLLDELRFDRRALE